MVIGDMFVPVLVPGHPINLKTGLNLKLLDTFNSTHMGIAFEVAPNQIQTELKLTYETPTLKDIWVEVDGVRRPELWTYSKKTLVVRLEPGAYRVAWRK